MYFPFFPDHTDLDLNRRVQRNPNDVGELIGHAGIEEASVFFCFQKLQGSIDLASTHDDVRGIAIQLKTLF